jgi:bacterioferritin
MTNDFIVKMNDALAREYAAAIQYIQHAAVLDGFYTAYDAEILVHADEEFGHAKKLSDHINYLGGIPVALSAPAFTASDNQRMLQQDLTGENEAIAIYKELIAMARAVNDYCSEIILMEILTDEQDHANFLETILQVVK